jgi:hypothetical protein
MNRFQHTREISIRRLFRVVGYSCAIPLLVFGTGWILDRTSRVGHLTHQAAMIGTVIGYHILALLLAGKIVDDVMNRGWAGADRILAELLNLCGGWYIFLYLIIPFIQKMEN